MIITEKQIVTMFILLNKISGNKGHNGLSWYLNYDINKIIKDIENQQLNDKINIDNNIKK
jgi:hypothetical protein